MIDINDNDYDSLKTYYMDRESLQQY